MPSWLNRQRLLLLVAVVFAIYVGILLANAYRSQSLLRSAAEARLLADSQQIAAVLADVITEQRNFVRYLAESHEVETFLINKALGMSMRYGLNANLYSIEESFRRKMAQKTVLGAPVYLRMIYVGDDGVPLADTSPSGSLPPLPTGNGADPEVFIDSEHGRIIASVAIKFRGISGGTIMTVADLALFSRYLASPSGNMDPRQILISEAGWELGVQGSPTLERVPAPALAKLPINKLATLGDLPGLNALSLNDTYDLVLRTPVAGTSISLVTMLPESMVYGHITSRLFLLVASAAPLLFLLTAVWIDHMQRRTKKLEADYIESNRNRTELRDQNVALTEEISRRERLERELRESEERYRTYIEHAPEGIFVADETGRYVDANPSACAMVGYSRDELLNMTVTSLSPPGLLADHMELLKGIQRDGSKEAEITLRRKDEADVIANLRAITLPGGLVMGFCVDVTERKQAEEQIRNLAYYDPLTGLPNRRLLLDRLRRAMASTTRDRQYGALLMLDLDNFKNLNDTQGHDMGDRLLIEVAGRLSKSMRLEDTVARLGGDEYVVVAEGLGTEESVAALQAEIIAEKVHKILAQPYVLTPDRPTHHSTPSIGVTLFSGQDIVVDVLLKQADVALYQAKNAGRNTIRFFNPDMQAAIDGRAMMETALRRGIMHNELRLYFQPQVDWRNNVTGAEALLRWQPSDSELVPPNEFIPLAEETGLIIPIGNWVLEQACAQLRRWQSTPRTCALTLSINVSARQFHQPDFVEEIWSRIEQFGIDPGSLKLELTESVVLARVDEVIERMQKLKALGVGFSLDDFGTGYSSLSYLKRLPLDQVKIDQSFVRDITRDQNDVAIVRAILAMSQSLGLNVIAEGVETEEQRAFLLRYGCENYQGYLFGRPAPIETIPSLSTDRD